MGGYMYRIVYYPTHMYQITSRVGKGHGRAPRIDSHPCRHRLRWQVLLALAGCSAARPRARLCSLLGSLGPFFTCVRFPSCVL
jgi:hypothetical protein